MLVFFGICDVLDAVFSVIVPFKTLVPGEVRAVSPNNDRHIYPRPDLSWEGLGWPWGSSVAVLGSGSAYIQLSFFSSTALAVTSSSYLLQRQIKRNLRELFLTWVH